MSAAEASATAAATGKTAGMSTVTSRATATVATIGSSSKAAGRPAISAIWPAGIPAAVGTSSVAAVIGAVSRSTTAVRCPGAVTVAISKTVPAVIAVVVRVMSVVMPIVTVEMMAVIAIIKRRIKRE